MLRRTPSIPELSSSRGSATRTISKLVLLVCTLAVHSAPAEILYEGYFRIEKDNHHYGYLIQSLKRDPKSGRRDLTTYVRSKPGEKEVFEVFKSISKDASGGPVSSLYDSTVSGAPVHIFADFGKCKGPRCAGTVTMQYNRVRKPASVREITDISFTDSFLFFVTDFGKMAKGKLYGYRTYNEERGTAAYGFMQLVDEKTVSGARVFQVMNDYNGTEMENFVAPSGEPLGSRNPAHNFIAYWVPSRELATDSLGFPKDEIRRIFGEIPGNGKNPWAKSAELEASHVIGQFRPSPGLRPQKRRRMISLPLPTRRM